MSNTIENLKHQQERCFRTIKDTNKPSLTSQQVLDLAFQVQEGLNAIENLGLPRTYDKKVEKFVSGDENSKLVSIGLKARNTLVQAHLKYVFLRVVKYRGRSKTANFDDLYQEACLKTVRGVEKYKPDKNATLITFLDFYIKNGTMEARRHSEFTILSAPKLHLRIKSLLKAKQYKLIEELGRNPTDQEIASSFGISLNLFEDIKTLDSVTEFDCVIEESFVFNNYLACQGEDEDEILTRKAILLSDPHWLERSSETRLGRNINKDPKKYREIVLKILNQEYLDDEDQKFIKLAVLNSKIK